MKQDYTTTLLRVASGVLLFGASAGGFTAVIAGLGVARRNDYAELGFLRNAALSIGQKVEIGLQIGLSFALIYLILWAVDAWLSPRSSKLSIHHCAAALVVAGVLLVAEASAPRFVAAMSVLAIVSLYTYAATTGATSAAKKILHQTAGFLSLASPSLVLGSLWIAPEPALEQRLEWLAAGATLALLTLTLGRTLGPYRAPAARPRTSPLVIGPSLLLLAGAAVCWLALPQFGSTLPAPNPQNVLFVIVDTLRQDATSLNEAAGSATTELELTPSLTELRSDSTVFTTAISQAPWTLPATASLLTGLYPSEHGARGFTSELGERHVTLAEILTEAGYRTKAVVSNSYLRELYGLSQGFQEYDESLAKSDTIFWDITSEQVTDQAIQMLNGSPGRPFFLLAHYFDPHASFRDHEDQQQADQYGGWLHGPVHKKAELDLRINAYRLAERDVEYLRELYAEEVAATDVQIGRLLSALEDKGLADNTAIVFVSDHGEEFFERGWVGHTVHLSDDMVKVPLAMSLPGVEQVDFVREPVETRAVFQTVLDYLEIKNPNQRTPSLLPAITGAEAPPGLAFTEVRTSKEHSAWPARTALSGLRTQDYKIIFRHLDSQYELYDLSVDPVERHDVAQSNPDALASLRALLDVWMGTDEFLPGEEPSRLSPEAKKQLRALGYIN